MEDQAKTVAGMSSEDKAAGDAHWQQIVDELREQLLEAQEILQAISHHKVDAFVIRGPQADQVYTLKGADHAYQVILESINEGAATVGADSTIFYCNPAFAALLGMPIQQVIGTALTDHVVTEDLPLCLSLLEQGVIESSKGEVLLRAGGSNVPVLLSCSSLNLDEVQGICLVATDLSEQKRQAEIVAAETLARSILEQASAAMVVCDENGQVIRANHKAHQLCRRNPILHSFDEAFPLHTNNGAPTEAQTPFLLVTGPDKRSIQNQEVLLIHPNGEIVHLLISSAPLFDGDQQPLGSVITLVDISAHKQMEDRLRQARDELEQRVNERTAELVETNVRLEQEIEERKQTEAALIEVRQRLSQSQETERLLLARELHDGPLQEVIGMAFELLLLSQLLTDEELVNKVTAIGNSVQKTARHLRLMAQTLRPPILAHLGLAAAIRAHLKQVQDTIERPTFRFVSSDEHWSVPEETALALLRIVQQAIQNALQHAQANHIEVRLDYGERELRLEVEDDGQGFSIPYHRVEFARAGHLGVVGMAERVEAIRGQFEVISAPGSGTCVRVILPKPAPKTESGSHP